VHLPPDLCEFYYRSAGAELFGRGGAAAYRIVAAADIEPLDWGELPEEWGGNSRGRNGRIWHRLAWLADGSWLAINLDPNRRDPRPKRRKKWVNDSRPHAICHGHLDTQGRPGGNPVIALSFTELLERLLNSRGQPYWLDPRFSGYGDAEEWTRRD
jgi:hypothetical protein